MKKLFAVPFVFLAALLALVVGILALAWLLAPRAVPGPAAAGPAATGDTIAGSGHVRAETRQVRDFNAVVLSGPGELTIRQGAVEALAVEAEEELLPLVNAHVQDGILAISIEPPNPQDTLTPTRPIRYELTVKSLDALSTKGPGSISAPNIQAGSLRVALAGTGTLWLAGTVASQEVTISGSGRYQAGDLESREARVTVLGAGAATVWVHDRLQIHCTGACAVNHYGSPVVTKELIVGGAVAWLGDK